ncbi:MAG: hypothetical protein L0206_24720 [Actinobacteria bacterium]|nr:hypothetical protein [Actinomycetota bacterium]
MTTADVVREHALLLARTVPDEDEAVRELESASGGRRVAAVIARRQVSEGLDGDPTRTDAVRAIELLDRLLERLQA